METVRKGQHWGVLHFKENFTSAIYDRMFGLAELKIPSEDTLDRSEVHAWLDMTNQQVGYTIQLRLAEAYQAFSKGLLGACELPEDIANIPVAFEEPIYGSNSPTFTEFMAPGVILSITYFMAVGMTSLAFVLERKEGLLDRSWVAGVTATEVMVSHVVCQFVVMLAQVCLVLVFMIYVFEVPARGPMVWIVTLTLMQGICGMAFGLVISALCDNEQAREAKFACYGMNDKTESSPNRISGRHPTCPRLFLPQLAPLWHYLAAGGNAAGFALPQLHPPADVCLRGHARNPQQRLGSRLDAGTTTNMCGSTGLTNMGHMAINITRKPLFRYTVDFWSPLAGSR